MHQTGLPYDPFFHPKQRASWKVATARCADHVVKSKKALSSTGWTCQKTTAVADISLPPTLIQKWKNGSLQDVFPWKWRQCSTSMTMEDQGKWPSKFNCWLVGSISLSFCCINARTHHTSEPNSHHCHDSPAWGYLLGGFSQWSTIRNEVLLGVSKVVRITPHIYKSFRPFGREQPYLQAGDLLTMGLLTTLKKAGIRSSK